MSRAPAPRLEVLDGAEEVRLLQEHRAETRRRRRRQGVGVGGARRSSGELLDPVPSRRAVVASASRECGCRARETRNRRRPLCSRASQPAEATADGPSYRVAFETGRPVSSLIAVWYSNMTWSPPWETSGWYGVYGVRNSERDSSASTSDGT